MTKLINKDENGIIWIEADTGEELGIVSHNKILDLDGIPYPDDTLTILDIAGVNLEQDHENETTLINLDCGGSIEFCMGGVELKQA